MSFALPPRDFTPQQGFAYEGNVVKFLGPYGYCLNQIAGSSSLLPDVTLVKNGETCGCELKIQPASCGSLVLKYISGKWGFKADIQDPDKEFIKDMAKNLGVLKDVKDKWKEVPLKREPKPTKAQLGNLMPRQIYEIDQSRFKEIKGSVRATKVSEYYNKKNTFYINVGTRGFYLLGSSDPLGFNKTLKEHGLPPLKKFEDVATAIYRVRFQSKGQPNYQFTFDMNFTIPSDPTYPYNIAPVTGNGSIVINGNQANLSMFL